MEEFITRRARVLNHFVYLALIVLAIAIGLFLKWSFQRQDVLVINNQPFPVRTVQDGSNSKGIVIMKVDFCKNVAVKGQIRVSFVSSTREVFLPVAEETQGVGCQKADLPIVIPKDLISDTYKVKFRATYQLNPLRSVTNEFETAQFEVK